MSGFHVSPFVPGWDTWTSIEQALRALKGLTVRNYQSLNSVNCVRNTHYVKVDNQRAEFKRLGVYRYMG